MVEHKKVSVKIQENTMQLQFQNIANGAAFVVDACGVIDDCGHVLIKSNGLALVLDGSGRLVSCENEWPVRMVNLTIKADVI